MDKLGAFFAAAPSSSSHIAMRTRVAEGRSSIAGDHRSRAIIQIRVTSAWVLCLCVIASGLLGFTTLTERTGG